MGTKSHPSAPRPCRTMTVPCGSSPVVSSMWGRIGNSTPRGTDGGFRTESLHDLFARLQIRSADEVDAIGNGGEDARHERLALGIPGAFQRLADGLGLARRAA